MTEVSRERIEQLVSDLVWQLTAENQVLAIAEYCTGAVLPGH